VAVKTKHQAWTPAVWDLADASAVQGMANGTATPEQQKRALRWIIEAASGLYDMSFRPGGEDGRRDTDFAEGRRSVGNQIVKLIKADLATMRRQSNSDPHEPKA